ncbi:MAG: hypothetical protein KBT01_02420 [Clostridiales bacterium]|nr:hypothetical protein [Candidatus Blautia equi]
MSMTFEEQIAFLEDRFEVVPLSKLPYKDNPHLKLTQDFESRRTVDEKGNIYYTSVEGFIIAYEYNGRVGSWQAYDTNRADTSRIFLVIDTKASVDEKGNFIPQIAFYFGFSSGLVVGTPYQTNSPAEESLMNAYRDAMSLTNTKKKNEFLGNLDRYAGKLFDEATVRRIRKLAQKEIDIRLDREKTFESNHQSILGYRTYPGIELTHFVRNYKYALPAEITAFTLGDYVFWELLWNKLMIIYENLGVQYLYLFAADFGISVDPHSEEARELAAKARLKSLAGNMPVNGSSGKSSDPDITGKLVSYYRKHFGFKLLKDNALLKPEYDEKCISMSTSMAELQALRADKWGKR